VGSSFDVILVAATCWCLPAHLSLRCQERSRDRRPTVGHAIMYAGCCCWHAATGPFLCQHSQAAQPARPSACRLTCLFVDRSPMVVPVALQHLLTQRGQQLAQVRCLVVAQRIERRHLAQCTRVHAASVKSTVPYCVAASSSSSCYQLSHSIIIIGPVPHQSVRIAACG
jgi:hypothetical protein